MPLRTRLQTNCAHWLKQSKNKILFRNSFQWLNWLVIVKRMRLNVQNNYYSGNRKLKLVVNLCFMTLSTRCLHLMAKVNLLLNQLSCQGAIRLQSTNLKGKSDTITEQCQRPSSKKLATAQPTKLRLSPRSNHKTSFSW